MHVAFRNSVSKRTYAWGISNARGARPFQLPISPSRNGKLAMHGVPGAHWTIPFGTVPLVRIEPKKEPYFNEHSQENWFGIGTLFWLERLRHHLDSFCLITSSSTMDRQHDWGSEKCSDFAWLVSMQKTTSAPNVSE